MKKSDVRIGMKVVPFRKTKNEYSDFKNSWLVNRMRSENKRFAVVVGWDKEEKCWKLGTKRRDPNYDFFNSCDFRPYEEK